MSPYDLAVDGPRMLPVQAAAPAREVVRRIQRVVLVQPPVGGNENDVSPPLGLLLLGAILEREGREVRLCDLNLLAKTGGVDPARGSIRTQLGRAIPQDADLIGFTTWSYNFDVTMEAIEEVRKKRPDLPIVVGGPHATFVDRELLAAFPAVDHVLRDEGDWTFPRLLRALETGAHADDLAAIPGLTWRRGGEVVRNPSGPVVEDLDALPYPAYHLLDARRYLQQNPVLVLEAGRGCPYNCNFCSTTNMFQRRYRVKSPARLVDEIEWAIARTGTNRFELLHDNLVASRKHVLELCAEIRRRNIDVDWSCTSRTDNMTEELAEAMFLAGCSQVFFGVESMDPARQQWTGKRLQPERVEAAVRAVARHHIRPTVGIIVGFPDERDAELDATVEAAFRWTTDPAVQATVSTAILRWYPGADLFAHKDRLRWDPLASADSAAIPGYRIRERWRERDLAALFPLQSIHTPQEETRRNLLRTHCVRTLLKAAPLTTRAAFVSGAFGPRALLDALAAGRQFRFLRFEARGTDGMWNEVLAALGAVLGGRPELEQLLRWEAPFWETRAVSPPLDHLEHVVHPLRFDHDDLLAWAIGRRAEPPRPAARGQSIVGIRAGRETFVCTSDRPTQVLESFRQRLRSLTARRA